jgi:hypothetical protein
MRVLLQLWHSSSEETQLQFKHRTVSRCRFEAIEKHASGGDLNG